MADQQDIRRLGGLINILPFTYTIMVIGSLSLLATPWLTGFYSKDLIIELAYAQYTFSGIFSYILGSLTAGLTAFYSFRLISLTFLTYPNAKRSDYLNSHEAALTVIIPLTILALFSIFFGFVFSDLFVGMGSDFLSKTNSVFIHPDHIALIEAEFSLPFIIKLLPVILSGLGAFLSIFIYHFYPEILISITDNKLGRTIYSFLNAKFLFDVLYNKYIISGGFKVGYTISKYLDKGVIEQIGPYGLSTVLNKTGTNFAKLDTGVVTTYSLYIALGTLTLIFVVFAHVFLDTNLFSYNILNLEVSPNTSQILVGAEIRLFIIFLSTLILVLNTGENEY